MKQFLICSEILILICSSYQAVLNSDRVGNQGIASKDEETPKQVLIAQDYQKSFDDKFSDGFVSNSQKLSDSLANIEKLLVDVLKEQGQKNGFEAKRQKRNIDWPDKYANNVEKKSENSAEKKSENSFPSFGLIDGEMPVQTAEKKFENPKSETGYPTLKEIDTATSEKKSENLSGYGLAGYASAQDGRRYGMGPGMGPGMFYHHCARMFMKNFVDIILDGVTKKIAEMLAKNQTRVKRSPDEELTSQAPSKLVEDTPFIDDVNFEIKVTNRNNQDLWEVSEFLLDDGIRRSIMETVKSNLGLTDPADIKGVETSMKKAFQKIRDEAVHVEKPGSHHIKTVSARIPIKYDATANMET